MIYSALDSKLNSRLFTNPSTLYRPQLGLVFYPFRARYFAIIGSRFRLRRTDPHQSPIRFKAIVL